MQIGPIVHSLYEHGKLAIKLLCYISYYVHNKLDFQDTTAEFSVKIRKTWRGKVYDEMSVNDDIF